MLTRLGSVYRRVEELGRDRPAVRAVRRGASAAARRSSRTSRFFLRDYREPLEVSPGRLDEIESRLALIERLKRKYGATVEDVLAFGARCRSELQALLSPEEEQRELEERRERAASAFLERARALSKRRRAIARDLVRRVQGELAQLAMEKTRFEVLFTPADAERTLAARRPGCSPRTTRPSRRATSPLPAPPTRPRWPTRRSTPRPPTAPAAAPTTTTTSPTSSTGRRPSCTSPPGRSSSRDACSRRRVHTADVFGPSGFDWAWTAAARPARPGHRAEQRCPAGPRSAASVLERRRQATWPRSRPHAVRHAVRPDGNSTTGAPTHQVLNNLVVIATAYDLTGAAEVPRRRAARAWTTCSAATRSTCPTSPATARSTRTTSTAAGTPTSSTRTCRTRRRARSPAARTRPSRTRSRRASCTGCVGSSATSTTSSPGRPTS